MNRNVKTDFLFTDIFSMLKLLLFTTLVPYNICTVRNIFHCIHTLKIHLKFSKSFLFDCVSLTISILCLFKVLIYIQLFNYFRVFSVVLLSTGPFLLPPLSGSVHSSDMTVSRQSSFILHVHPSPLLYVSDFITSNLLYPLPLTAFYQNFISVDNNCE